MLLLLLATASLQGCVVGATMTGDAAGPTSSRILPHQQKPMKVTRILLVLAMGAVGVGLASRAYLASHTFSEVRGRSRQP